MATNINTTSLQWDFSEYEETNFSSASGDYILPSSHRFQKLFRFVTDTLPYQDSKNRSAALYNTLLAYNNLNRSIPAAAMGFLEHYAELCQWEISASSTPSVPLSPDKVEKRIKNLSSTLSFRARFVYDYPHNFRLACNPFFFALACMEMDTIAANGFHATEREMEYITILEGLSSTQYFWQLWDNPGDYYDEDAQLVWTALKNRMTSLYGSPSAPRLPSEYHKGMDYISLMLYAWSQSCVGARQMASPFVDEMSRRIDLVNGWDKSLFVKYVPKDVMGMGYWKWATKRLPCIRKLHRACCDIRHNCFYMTPALEKDMEQMCRMAAATQQTYVHNILHRKGFPMHLSEKYQRIYFLRNILLAFLAVAGVLLCVELTLSLIFVLFILRM